MKKYNLFPVGHVANYELYTCMNMNNLVGVLLNEACL